MKATGSYSPTKWDEKPYEQISPTMKLTRASVELSFKGEIVGEGLVEYLMFYDYFDQGDPHKSTATYVGLIRFKGQLKGKAGTFVMEDRGSFRQGTATSVLRMIPESGTGELKGIGGAGMYSASQEGCRCDLTYELK